MDWQVFWTQIALADLKQVHDYIARDSPFYAAAFVAKVRKSAASLRKMPRRCRITPEFNHPSVRDMIIGRYRLIFRVEGKRVFILAFIHGARDIDKTWEDEKRLDPRP